MEKRRAGYRLELSFIIPKDKFKEFVEGQKKVGGREINEIGELSKGMYIRSIADIPELYEMAVELKIERRKNVESKS